MLGTQSRPTNALLTWLPAIERSPYRYGFHLLLRCLESAYPNTPGLGNSTQPADDPVRVSQPPFLHFPASPVKSFSLGDEEQPAQLLTYLFGLFGPNGPLPVHLTEYFYQYRQQKKDDSLAAFFDLFQHRLLSLYYRAWADTEPVTAIDRGQASTFDQLIRSLAGSDGVQEDRFPEVEQHYYAGQLSARHQPVAGLTALLSDYFQLPFIMKTQVPRWVPLAQESRAYLQRTPTDNCRPGRGMMMGRQVLSAQHQISLTICFPSFQRYSAFIAYGSDEISQLRRMIKRYLGHSVEWRLTARVPKNQLPSWQFKQQLHLGQSVWLTRQPPKGVEKPLTNSISKANTPITNTLKTNVLKTSTSKNGSTSDSTTVEIPIHFFHGRKRLADASSD